MKQKDKIIIAAVLAILAIGAGVYVFLQKPQEIQPQPSQEQAPIPEESSLEKQFDALLNEFLKSVDEKAQAYKNERRVLAELVRPENLRDPAYVEQNYQLMKTTVPSLRLQIDDLMLVFENTEARVTALISGQPEEIGGPIAQEWQKLKQEQAVLYVSFFEIEEEMLRTFESLMEFYYIKQGSYKFDSVNNEILFDNPEDEMNAKALTSKLMELAQKESALLAPRP